MLANPAALTPRASSDLRITFFMVASISLLSLEKIPQFKQLFENIIGGREAGCKAQRPPSAHGRIGVRRRIPP